MSDLSITLGALAGEISLYRDREDKYLAQANDLSESAPDASALSRRLSAEMRYIADRLSVITAEAHARG